jgi:Iron-containing redox enzyme
MNFIKNLDIDTEKLLEAKDLSGLIDRLISLEAQDIDTILFDRQAKILALVEEVCQQAYKYNRQPSLLAIQNILAKIYELHYRIPNPQQENAESSFIIASIRNLIEKFFLEDEEKAIPASIWQEVPENSANYVDWFISLTENHPVYRHSLYEDYLKNHASLDDLRQFLIQESTIDTRFDDFLALLQVGTDGGVKLEIASNYWDEMGNGNISQMHVAMFSRTLNNLEIDLTKCKNYLTTEALICGNLSLMLSLYRKHFYKGIGYFAVTEYMTPKRFKHIIYALKRNKRNNFSEAEYYKEHITIDALHAQNWLKNVIVPVINKYPSSVYEITRGAIYRLNTSQKYLNSLLTKMASLV